MEFTFDTTDIKSKSSNSPFIGKKLKGSVLATILGNKLKIN
jgi:dihydroorotase-like cyclic amidohydrolase